MVFDRITQRCRCCHGASMVPMSRRFVVRAGPAALMSALIPTDVLSEDTGAPARSTASYADVTRKILERHPMPGNQELVMNEVTYPPGVAAPVHHHPAAGLNYILDGIAESAYGNDKPQVYRAGQTLQDKADVPHTLFRNLDPKRPLRFLNVYVLARGAQFTIVP